MNEHPYNSTKECDLHETRKSRKTSKQAEKATGDEGDSKSRWHFHCELIQPEDKRLRKTKDPPTLRHVHLWRHRDAADISLSAQFTTRIDPECHSSIHPSIHPLVYPSIHPSITKVFRSCSTAVKELISIKYKRKSIKIKEKCPLRLL